MGFDALEFRRAFDVEAADVQLQREVDFGAGFADAGKNDVARVAAGANDALEFAAGNDVEAGAERAEQLQHSEVAVGFHRVADLVRQRTQAPHRALHIAR